jgi:hypothetical protein
VGICSLNPGLQYSRLITQLDTFQVKQLLALAFGALDDFQRLAIP